VPLGRDLAVVYPPLAPVRLKEILADRDIGVIPVDGEEYETMGCNVLAVGPERAWRSSITVREHRPPARSASRLPTHGRPHAGTNDRYAACQVTFAQNAYSAPGLRS
jgi:hypothetical protein